MEAALGAELSRNPDHCFLKVDKRLPTKYLARKKELSSGESIVTTKDANFKVSALIFKLQRLMPPEA